MRVPFPAPERVAFLSTYLLSFAAAFLAACFCMDRREQDGNWGGA